MNISFSISEIFTFLQKSRRKAGDGLTSGRCPFFTSSQVQTKWFSEADYQTNGAIILGTGGAPSVHYAKHFSTSADVFTLASKGKDISTKYVYYFLVGHKDILERGFKGAGLKHLSRDYVQKIQIPIPVDKNGKPDLAEQERIVAVLEEAEKLKQKRAEADQKMSGLIPALFVKMFGDPLLETGQSLSPLKDFIKIKHGFAFKSKYFTNEGEYVLLTPGNFYEDGGYRDRGGKQKFYNGSIPKEYLLEKGALLVAMTQQAPGLLASPILVPESEKFLHNQRLGLVIFNDKYLNSRYLFSLFNYPAFRQIVENSATGTKVQHTSPSKIEEIKIFIPPIALQNKFAEAVKEIVVQKEKQKQSAMQIDSLFSSLLVKSYE